jgi:FAD/FMN-containing dehydrogenase
MTYLQRSDTLSWGRLKRAPQFVSTPRFRGDLPGLVSSHPGRTVLATGLHRSYGDSALNSDGALIDMSRLDRVMAFDPVSGVLRAEGGASLDEILQIVVPHGFFIPVTPGTRFVTLAGAIANDVHGKNHHRFGTIGRHTRRFGLLRSDGEELDVDFNNYPELYAATIGGLGLTGIITWVEIQLAPITSSQLDVETIPFVSIDEFWALAADSTESHEHTVAWIDCTSKGEKLGRGIFSRANWCAQGKFYVHPSSPTFSVPFETPMTLLNAQTVGVFNACYFALQKRRAGICPRNYESLFYPLDAIANWNKLYGRKGFWQYQCVLPPSTMKVGIATLLNTIAASGEGSFLGVLKTFGSTVSPGMLSFPMAGATLALDFVNKSEETMRLFDTLDSIVREGRGRLYAAKDGRIPKALWVSEYPNLESFSRCVDPAFGSDFWNRVAA